MTEQATGDDGGRATVDDEGTAEGAEQRLHGDRDFAARLDEVIEKIQSKEDEEDLGPLLSELDDIEDVLDEAEDLLSTVNVSELVAAIDWESLPDAVDASAVPDAIQDGDVGDAIDLRALLGAVDLSALLDNVDEREFWREKREFDDELEDVTGDGSDDGSDHFDFDVDVDPEAIDDDLDPRAIQASVQREISGAVGEFREKLIEAHHRLDELREENEERFDRRRASKSRNPTAGFSTMTSDPVGGAVGGRFAFSTVPEETRYSTAPNRKRIYGDRFDSAGGGADG